MNTIPNLLLAALLLSSFGAMEAGVAPDAQDGGLPALIKEKEKGVFYLRVLNKDGQEISSGTGFLVDGKGTLVTALHVILPKRDVVGTVEALDANGIKWIVKGVSASDSSIDLAILKLAKVPEAARPLELAEDQLPVRGAEILVLGHPQGFQFVATDGIVSATHKTDQLPQHLRQSGFIHSAADVVWIQTTAAVSNGNSGGPVLDKSGKVIGIVQWMTRGQGLNFALQVAAIRKLLAEPEQLQTLVEFTEPQADFSALIKDLQMDHMKLRRMNFNPFGFPEEKKPAAEGDPLLKKYVPALLALANKHRGKDVEFSALLMLMNLTAEGEPTPQIAGDLQKVTDRLLQTFRDDHRLLPFLRGQSISGQPEEKEFFVSLSKTSSDPEIRALAALAAARSIDVNANNKENLKAAIELARSAANCPPKIMFGPEPLAKVAERLVDMLEHTSVGCMAPELAGIDQHGNPVKLSALKGRYVALVFYTEENEFRSNVAAQLNEIVKYGEGRPLSVIGVQIEFPNRFFSGSGKREIGKTWTAIKDDSDGTLRQAWRIEDAPTAFLIDPKQVIISRFAEPAKPQSGMDFMNMFGGMNHSESDWKKQLLKVLKSIPELETQMEKLANIPNRLSAGHIDSSILKGLELRYSFDEKKGGTVHDSSSKKRHIKATGGGWSNDPKTGGCHKIAPGSQLIAENYRGVTGAKPRTVALWFKNERTQNGPVNSLVIWGKGRMAQRFDLRIQNSELVVAVSSGHIAAKTPTNLLQDRKWHHLAVTLPENGKLPDVLIYIDGKPAETAVGIGGERARQRLMNGPLNTAPAMPVTIGSKSVSGFVDDVMIWERCLDANEIARLHKATGGQTPPPLPGMAELKKAGLEGLWEVQSAGVQGPLVIRLGDNGLSGTIQLRSKSGQTAPKQAIFGQPDSGKYDFQFRRKIAGRGEQIWRGNVNGNKITGIWTGVGSSRATGEEWTATRK